MKTILDFIALSLCLCIVTHAMQKSGTGFAVSPDLILTAYHVVENGESISVAFGDTSFPATISSFNKELDWALLKISGIAPATVQLGDSDAIKLGDGVYTLGYPATDLLGDEIKFSKGEIGSLSGFGGSKNHFQISVPIQPGNSGGPLFSQSGEVIGIIVSTIDPGVFFSATEGALPQGINYALKIRAIPNMHLSNDILTAPHSVEANQKAIGLVTARIPRAAISIPERRPSPVKPPQTATPLDEYELKLNEIEDKLSGMIAQLTEFSPETFCQTNGSPGPILTEEEADAAQEFLDKVKLEIEFAAKQAESEILKIPDRIHHKFDKSSLYKKEKHLFSRYYIEKDWIAARNRLTEYCNEIAKKNGVIPPITFWGLSLSKKTFEKFSDWENMPFLKGASIGSYIMEKPFLGSCIIHGIRSEPKQTPLALWCLIPTGTHAYPPKPSPHVFPETPDYYPEGHRYDLSGKILKQDDLLKYQDYIAKLSVRVFECKYKFRFSVSNILYSDYSGIAPLPSCLTDTRPIIRGAIKNKIGIGFSDFYFPGSYLYYYNSTSLNILICGYCCDNGKNVSGTGIFISLPNWREIIEAEQHAAKMSETIEVDDNMLEGL